MAPSTIEEPERLSLDDIRDAWPLIPAEERLDAFRALETSVADDFFLGLGTDDQLTLLLALPEGERRIWVRLLPPDDAADLIQAADEDLRDHLFAQLDDQARQDVRALLAYAEDDAGGLMDPRYARVRPDMTVDEALTYLRRQLRERSGIAHYAYAIDPDHRLVGVVSFRELFAARPEQRVDEIMEKQLITVLDTMDQEDVAKEFERTHLVAVPVVDAEGRMKGVVTADDIVEVVREEATEDIQKIGGTAALGAPYLNVGVLGMIRRRAPWLAILFVGEMLTAAAMSRFEHEIARAVILAMFVPLVISSGGNSGGQASTLVIRALALGEVQLRDWWRVVRREFVSGLGLGVILGGIGVLQIVLFQALFQSYGTHATGIALTVGLSLIGVVLWGTLAGSMLPILLDRMGLDPASASAPFVATLVDVTGLIIYFTMAKTILAGTLL